MLHGNSFYSASWWRLTAIFFSCLAAGPHSNSVYSASQWHLSAILFNPPHSSASWRFFFFRLTVAPIGDSFYPALIQESSHHLLTWFCSVCHSPRVAWPAHILSHLHGIKYLTSMSVLSFVLLWYPPWERGLLEFLLRDSGMGPVLFMLIF